MKKTSDLTSFLALSAFVIFAVCVLAVLVSGVKVYGNLVRSGGEQYARRVAAQYVTMRVRQAEQISVEDFGGCEALVLREEIGGKAYITRVYCHEGMLRELFCAETAMLMPEDGEPVTEAEGLEASLEDGVLTVRIGAQTLVLRAPPGKGAAP